MFLEYQIKTFYKCILKYITINQSISQSINQIFLFLLYFDKVNRALVSTRVFFFFGGGGGGGSYSEKFKPKHLNVDCIWSQ